MQQRHPDMDPWRVLHVAITDVRVRSGSDARLETVWHLIDEQPDIVRRLLLTATGP